VTWLFILEPGVRRFRAAFIVAKAASTVSGAPAGAHHAEREIPVARADRLLSDAPPAQVAGYLDSRRGSGNEIDERYVWDWTVPEAKSARRDIKCIT